MKRIAIIAASLLICVAGYAQNEAKCKEDWKQKMMSEKIAFLTMELNLTPEEAQMFWPVYNLENKEADKAIGNTISCYRALAKAIEEGKAEGEISKLLDDYLKAQEGQKNVSSKAAAQYKKVLPVEKVAKLYIAEEKFRRQHIRRLHGGHDGHRPDQAKR